MKPTKENVPEELLKEIGRRLREVRDTLKISLEDMKKLSRVSRGYISEFERGKRLPASRYLYFLIKTYGIDINYIYTGKGQLFTQPDGKGKNIYDFGKYEEEIEDLLYHITHIPNALYAVLGHFADYKVEKEKLIKNYLAKITAEENEDNEIKEKVEE
ncbi:MAG: helix-turn-helix domain-containing protein [Methanomicrobiales archaeon]|jgi:transcriptional regulator with XRE-family HTH domain|nr:helix-turn-helix domain-containing protein [Methanomicrobiales archaeon]